MFGIFHEKHVFFQEMMISPWCVSTTIAYCCGISINQLMLGIGEVWHFLSKTGAFQEMIISPVCVSKTIAYRSLD